MQRVWRFTRYLNTKYFHPRLIIRSNKTASAIRCTFNEVISIFRLIIPRSMFHLKTVKFMRYTSETDVSFVRPLKFIDFLPVKSLSASTLSRSRICLPSKFEWIDTARYRIQTSLDLLPNSSVSILFDVERFRRSSIPNTTIRILFAVKLE